MNKGRCPTCGNQAKSNYVTGVVKDAENKRIDMYLCRKCDCEWHVISRLSTVVMKKGRIGVSAVKRGK